MAKSKKSTQKESSSVLNRKQIQEKLETVLAELKPSLGEKKFKRRMKKAGKLISSGLDKKAKAKKNIHAVIVPPVNAEN